MWQRLSICESGTTTSRSDDTGFTTGTHDYDRKAYPRASATLQEQSARTDPRHQTFDRVGNITARSPLAHQHQRTLSYENLWRLPGSSLASDPPIAVDLGRQLSSRGKSAGSWGIRHRAQG
jgi:hypothetical protein